MKGKPNFENRTLFHGDNLDFLRSINTGTVDLIATDPPFNKGRDFHATPESLAAGASFQDRWLWKKDVHESWIDQMQDDWPGVWAVVDWTRMTHSDAMAAFLCFMAVRLVSMHRVLKETGSIYLHCDPTASHYLKTLMDAIFGPKCFRNEIVWGYPPTGRPPKQGYPRKHDILLFYAKGDANTWSQPYTEITEATLKAYSSVDKDGRRYSKAHGGVTYLDEIKGRPVPSWWSDIGTGSHMPSKERVGYPTQKPLKLYRRIIRASSNPGDVVLDPFCGCATTPIAAELEGRKWLGMDLWDQAPQMVTDRLAREVAVGEGKQGDLLARKVHVRTEPLVRTDDGETAAPRLKSLKRKLEAPTMSRQAMIDQLKQDHGNICQGCGFEFPHDGFIELDHSLPRTDGGSNGIENRVLLCGPCNRHKSNTLTLTGLRAEIKKLGRTAEQLSTKE